MEAMADVLTTDFLVLGSGIAGLSFALAIIIIGASLLMLSAFWQAMRQRLLPLLPEYVRNHMPITV